MNSFNQSPNYSLEHAGLRYVRELISKCFFQDLRGSHFQDPQMSFNKYISLIFKLIFSLISFLNNEYASMFVLIYFI